MRTEIVEIDKLPNNKAILDQHRCNFHHKNLEAYCDNDKELLCINCLIDNHKSHSVLNIEKAYMKEKEYLDSQHNKLQEKNKEFLEICSKIDQIILDFRGRIEKNLNTIDVFYQKIQVMIENRINHLKTSLKNHENSYLNKINDIKSKFTGFSEQYQGLNLDDNIIVNSTVQIDFLKSVKSRISTIQKLSNSEKFIVPDESFLVYFRHTEEVNILKNLLTYLDFKEFDQEKENGQSKIKKLEKIKFPSKNKVETHRKLISPITNTDLIQSKDILQNSMFELDKEEAIYNKKIHSCKTRSNEKLLSKEDSVMGSKTELNEVTKWRIMEYTKGEENENDFIFQTDSSIIGENSILYGNIQNLGESLQRSYSQDYCSLYKKSSYSIVVFGGKSDKNVTIKINPENKKITEIKSARIDLYDFNVISHQEKRVLLLGGKSNCKSGADLISNKIWLFSYDSLNILAYELKLKSPRTNFGCVYYDNKIYVCGGNDGKDDVYSFEKFDKKRKLWVDLPKMLTRRKDFCMINAGNNNFYLIGGSDDKDNTLKTVERFDALKETWSKVESMNQSRRSFSCLLLPDGIYVFGGINGNTCLSSVEKYEFATKKWKFLDNMIHPKSNFSCVCSVDYQYIYTIGGFNEKPLNIVERFNVLTNKWEVFLKMDHWKYRHNSVLILDNC